MQLSEQPWLARRQEDQKAPTAGRILLLRRSAWGRRFVTEVNRRKSVRVEVGSGP